MYVFHGSIGKHETFTVKSLCFDNRVLKMVGRVFLNYAGSILVNYIPRWVSLWNMSTLSELWNTQLQRAC